MRLMCFSSIFLLFLVAVAIISAADQWEKEVEVVELDTKAINSDHQLADNKEMKPLQQEEVSGKTEATSCLGTYKVFQPNLDFFKVKEDVVEVVEQEEDGEADGEAEDDGERDQDFPQML